MNKQRLFESCKLTFAIIGAAGYAGLIASMHLFFQVLSVATISAVLYGVYQHIEIV
jgi:hypothetical protein